MIIRTIAVIGAGVMGTDVALNLACYDYAIMLKDTTQEILQKAQEKIVRDFKMLKMMKKEISKLLIDDVLSKIQFTTEYSHFDTVDLVIENIVENFQAKKRLYAELQQICRDDTFYAINTSCISITRVASLFAKPENVIGMHFMNPVPLKALVETIRGYHTSAKTEKMATAFLRKIGKNPVVVNDSPGFVSNRLSHLFMNEAAFLIQDGVASPKHIDIIFKQGYEHKMGPLETADLIGLDTLINSLDILYESYQDPKFRCCPLLRKMVDAGLLGRKSGKGFYEYT